MVKYRLKDLFNLFAGDDIDIEHFSEYKTPIYCFPIYSNSLNNKGLYGYTSAPKYKGNSITITGRGAVGHAEYRKQDFDAIIRLLVLIPKKSNIVNSYYLTQFINQYVSFPLESTGVPQLTVPQIENIEVALPDYTQQVAIAKALSDIDSLLSSIQKLIEKKKAIKQGAMQELLAGKKRLPGFYGEWKHGVWKDVLTGFYSGATPYRGRADYYKGNIRWVSSGELNYNIIKDTIEHISEKAKSETSLMVHPAGTFLMAITGLEAAGTRGRCAILGKDATTNQSCMAIYGTDKMIIPYLYHYYLLNGEDLALQYCQGTKQQSYTAAIVKELPIYYPCDIGEQQAIAQVLSDMDGEIEQLEKKLSKYRQIKQGMMQELLTGRIRLV